MTAETLAWAGALMAVFAVPALASTLATAITPYGGFRPQVTYSARGESVYPVT